MSEINDAYTKYNTMGDWRLRRTLLSVGLQLEDVTDKDGKMVRETVIEKLLVSAYGEEKVDEYLESLEEDKGSEGEETKETKEKKTTKTKSSKAKPAKNNKVDDEEVDPDEEDDSELEVDPDDVDEEETKKAKTPKERTAIKSSKKKGKASKEQAKTSDTAQRLDNIDEKLAAIVNGIAVLRMGIDSVKELIERCVRYNNGIVASLNEGLSKIAIKIGVKKMKPRLLEAQEKAGCDADADESESE